MTLLRALPPVIALGVLTVCGCTSKPRAKPTSIEIGSADASAAEELAGDAPVTSRDGGSQYPPTGYYEVTARVIADDCQPRYTPPSPWTVAVQSGAERGRAKVNIGLAAIPPSNATHASARSDILIEPRRAFTSKYTPMPACPSYTTTRSFELVDSDPNGFTLVVTVEHGDGNACSSLPPGNCTTKVEYAYKLARASCPAECTRGIVFRRDGGTVQSDLGMEVDCRC